MLNYMGAKALHALLLLQYTLRSSTVTYVIDGPLSGGCCADADKLVFVGGDPLLAGALRRLALEGGVVGPLDPPNRVLAITV